MNFLSAFRTPTRPEAQWFKVGPASSFPDLGLDDEDTHNLVQPRPCQSNTAHGCKVFHVPKDNPRSGTEVSVPENEAAGDMTDQVLIFQRKGTFHAIDHQCPHSSFPLSQGIPFDIEDFGIVLSAGITCPKHGWSFDLFSGRADRGNYKLKVWEVQLRDPDDGTSDKDVWVRRKQRIG
ncbi:hypothetical protein QBC40DRAFT_228460 [Triangularia verruculosa]|uniref:Rieske domain-containing protein n=1 Tax=Triangularia verruculosa TaxID=2587418 RepID=A0AAN6XEF7_9PEZI|nr:hypothetical protein QBC40DRAFT_228460 [Triangularia verruculosa]